MPSTDDATWTVALRAAIELLGEPGLLRGGPSADAAALAAAATGVDPVELWWSLVNDCDDVLVLMPLARNEFVPPDALVRLARRTVDEVLPIASDLASNPMLPAEAIELLAALTGPPTALVTHANTPEDLRVALATRLRPETLSGLLVRKERWASLDRHFAADPDDRVRTTVATWTYDPVALDRLSRDWHPDVRAAAARKTTSR